MRIAYVFILITFYHFIRPSNGSRIKVKFVLIECNTHNLIIPGSPFIFSTNNGRRQVEWQQPEDDWNITLVPRSVQPHLELKNYQHNVPPVSQMRVIDGDDRIMERLQNIKVNIVF